jgi:hypothetical protein
MNPRDLPHHAPHPNHLARAAHREPCIALVDAHFLAWLQGREDDAAHHAAARREALAPQLLGSLADAGVHADMVRIYWYSAQRDAAAVNGQIVRPVQPQSTDDGRSLMLALARDLTQLAEHRACAHVLLVADDDRLLPAVDAAQLRGLQVHMLVDDKAADPDALERSDAAWAALLRHADRRVPLRGAPPPRREVALMEPADILEVVRDWWADVPDADREDLKEMLPRDRGLPQEADRQLLLRLSQRLGRALELPERKVMRESARRLLEGLPLEEAPAPEA